MEPSSSSRLLTAMFDMLVFSPKKTVIIERFIASVVKLETTTWLATPTTIGLTTNKLRGSQWFLLITLLLTNKSFTSHLVTYFLFADYLRTEPKPQPKIY